MILGKKRPPKKAAEGSRLTIPPHLVPLTLKQKAFLDAYLTNGFNGTQAAKAAGYDAEPPILAGIAHENLRKPNVREQIRIFELENQRKFKATLDDIEQFLLAVFYFDPLEANEVGSRGCNPLTWDQMPKHVRLAIQDVSRTETEVGTRYQVKPYDKMAAVDRLAKYCGLQKGPDGAGSDARRGIIEAALARVRGRAAKRGDGSGEGSTGHSQGGE